MQEINYSWVFGGMLSEQQLEECSELYSNHYGKWSQAHIGKAGQRIRLSPDRIRLWLEAPGAAIYYATVNDKIIGYAIANRNVVPKYGVISWVTQLVVHEDYRNQCIAKNLLFSVWGLSDDFAWGIVSANPYAIRALEKATRRRAVPLRIKKNIRKIMSVGNETISYINAETEYFVDENNSKINTKFFVDHQDIPEMLSKVVSEDSSWILGDVEEGWEWIAFTFKDQQPIDLTPAEIENMVLTSDSIAQQAYARMIASSSQDWMKRSIEEIDFISKECNITHRSSVVDFGCGIGRHSLELASRGVNVTGIDYVHRNIEYAEEQRKKMGIRNVDFIEGDCRFVQLEKKFDVAICIYDVIGSFSDMQKNQEILNNIAYHLINGAFAIISVMNFESTEAIAKHKFSFSKNPNELLTLQASTIMETTGNVFQPDYYMIDSDTHLVYRREQFTKGSQLPIELVVRDRRFCKSEIEKMCEQAGLEVIFSMYVNARDWTEPLNATDSKAKEILIKCRKHQ